MKKLVTLTALLALSSVAVAGFQSNNNNHQGGGFNSQSVTPQVTSVAQALKANDHDSAQLTGAIVRQLDDDEFIFRDATGEIKIDVEDKAWQGQNVGVNDKITVYGQVDRETIGSNSVDVYRIEKH